MENSLAHYIELYDSAPVGYLTLNSEGIVEEINLTAAKLLGKERKDIVNQHFEFFLTDEGKDSWNPHFHRVKHNPGKFSFVLTNRSQNGDSLSLQLDCLSYLEDEKHLCIRITLTDITDYTKIRDAEFQKLVERYELVLEGAQDAIWDWDVPNKHIHFSSRWKIMRGFADHEVGTDEKEWLDSIHPDDKPQVLAAVQAHFEGITPVFCEEYRVRCKDGYWKWILDRGIAKKDRSGTVIRMAGSENDITGRKNAEATLLEQENQLRLIMNLTPALVSYLDTNFRYLKVNKAYEAWYGLTMEAIIGHGVWEVIGELAWEKIQPYLLRASSGETVRYNQQLKFTNNLARWVDLTFVPDIDSTGTFRGIVVHVADIEEFKLTEMALRESDERMRLATQATGVGIWEWNIVTNHIRWDAQMFRIYGIPPTKDYKVPYDTWSAALVSEDLPKREAILQDTIHTGGQNWSEFRIQFPGAKGIRQIQAVETARTNAQGQVEWVVGTNLDITNRKNDEMALIEQENALRLIINSMPALIAYVDTEYRYRRVNTTYEQWFGVPVGEVVGHEVKEIIGDAAWQGVKPYFERAMSGEQLHFELQLPYKNAKPRWVHAHYVPDKDSAGNVRGIVKLIVDIGELKAAQQKIATLNQDLQHRIEEMEAIFNTAPIGICITNDTSAECIRGNILVEKLFGVPPHSELSLGSQSPPPLKVTIDGRELPIDELPMQRAARGETVTDLILKLDRPDGKPIALLCNAAPLFNAQGLPRGAVGVFQDVTALQNAEMALLESEERLRQAQSAGKLGIYDHNLVTGEMQWDGRLRELWGLKPDEVVTSAVFLKKVHPDDRVLLNAAIKHAFDPQGSGEYFVEYRITNPTDNRTTWVAAFGTTTFTNGRPVRLVGFVQDISERKVAAAKLINTEMRLSLAMEELNAGYWSWELEENTVYFSPAWKRQIGYEDHELSNQYEEWEGRLHPDDRAYVLATVENYLHNFLPDYELEFRLRHKDGSYRWIHSIAKLTHDQDNRLVNMVGIHLDITEYKQTKENNEKREKMEETFRLNVASQTVAAIAHELNQPLIAISYFADASVDMVQKGNPDPQKLISVLENCSEQAQRAGHVIRTLMSILHKNDLIKEPMDINKAINAALNIIKTNERLNADIELKLAVNLPLVMANEMQIQKVLVILLQNGLNAIQETATKTGKIAVTTCRSSNTSTQALVTVSDTGVGVLDEAELAKIFQPFYSSKEFGLGMGLTISRSLIEAHGGNIWAERNIDSGISVHFTLPFVS